MLYDKIFILFFTLQGFAADNFLAPNSWLDRENGLKTFRFDKNPVRALNFDAGYLQIGKMIHDKLTEKRGNNDDSPVFVMIWGYNGAGTTAMSKLIRENGFSFVKISPDKINTYIEEKTNQELGAYKNRGRFCSRLV